MKRLGIALMMMVMLLVGATSAMARDRVVSYEDLPAKAQTTINKHFHKKKIVLVKKIHVSVKMNANVMIIAIIHASAMMNVVKRIMNNMNVIMVAV